MEAQRQVFLVSHTHWDREWYLTREKSRFLLLGLMEELFTILREQPDYTFMLDGQTIPLEDYLAMMPDRRAELAGHVRSGRVSIGPWYVLPDELLVSGESHIRNYLVGRRLCDELGGNMNLGYLPDSFGHPSQMPQILAGLGMKEIVFWRGLGPEITRTELLWEGRDGTEILGVNTPFSYGIAACMPEEPQAFARRLRLKIGLVEPLTDGNVLLLMNGVDHVAPQGTFLPNLKKAGAGFPGYELHHATLKEYLSAVRAQPAPRERARGELRSGYRAYLLGGTISTRMYLKQANHRAQILLEKHAEPLSTLAWLVNGSRYPEQELHHAWKLLLSNHPHDSICGCGIDAIHEEMMQRYRWLGDLTQSIVDRACASIGRAMAGVDAGSNGAGVPAGWDGSFTVWNPLERPRTDVVRVSLGLNERLLRKVNFETGALDESVPQPAGRQPTGVVVRGSDGREIEGVLRGVREEDSMRLSLSTQPEMYRVSRVEIEFVSEALPSVGVAAYDLRLTYGEPQRAADATSIENDLFRVSFEQGTGSLAVQDLRTGIPYPGLHVFEDSGDAGDEYTYSWPARDLRCTLAPGSARVRVGGTRRFPVLVMTATLRVPARLAEDRQCRSAQMTEIGIESTVSLYPGVPRIDIVTEIENTAEDHRLRVLFPLGAPAAVASAEGIFSVDDRPTTPADRTAFADWVEPPSTNPQKSFVSVHAGERGLAVANRGLPEHEVFPDPKGDAVIALTLLRSVGWLSRPDLLARKGNGGWTLPTPQAQCLGRHRFEYSIIPHRGSWEEGGVMGIAHAFEAPALAFANTHAAAGCRTLSLVAVDREEIVLSAVKRAESGDACLLRFWNASGRTVRARLTFSRAPLAVYRTDLAERRLGRLPASGNRCEVEFGPWKVVTLEAQL
ncbi:MAG TPA: glycosyl hydrolase-related protein [Spirochaetia bacterium]|nr:glycosyl hydrolase-related protein [Spirochaetia bacterium]